MWIMTYIMDGRPSALSPKTMVMNAANDAESISGGCLCGAVRYQLRPPLRPAVACHCQQCRRTSGNYVNATAVLKRNFALTISDGLKWYRSSRHARRGFCGICGSSLLWSRDALKTISIMTGTIDGATGLHTAAHICVADKGDYYELNPSEPQYQALDYPSPWPDPPANE
jgi:hypothetical protein